MTSDNVETSFTKMMDYYLECTLPCQICKDLFCPMILRCGGPYEKRIHHMLSYKYHLGYHRECADKNPKLADLICRLDDELEDRISFAYDVYGKIKKAGLLTEELIDAFVDAIDKEAMWRYIDYVEAINDANAT